MNLIKSNYFDRDLFAFVEHVLAEKIVTLDFPAQGMSGQVALVATISGRSYAIKYGKTAYKEAIALRHINDLKLNLQVPVFLGSYDYQNSSLVILSRIQGCLLEEIPIQEFSLLLPSIFRFLNTLHTIKAENPGYMGSPQSSWRKLLCNIFSGQDFDWNEIAKRPGLDTILVLDSVAEILGRLHAMDFEEGGYSLLHTDFNQRNVFVDREKSEISGVVDWEEAMFGDPIFDLARVRMYLWHFKADQATLKHYYKLSGFNSAQLRRESVYWLIRVIQYLAWYSEELNDFNRARIALHQTYLREYDWRSLQS